MPDDTTLAARLRATLESDSQIHTQITPSIVKTIRLRLGFCRSKIQLLFSTFTISPAQPQHTKLLPLSDQTATSPNNTQPPTTAKPDQTQALATSIPDQQQTLERAPSDQGASLTSTASDQQHISSPSAPYNAHMFATSASDNLQVPSGFASDNAFIPNNTQTSPVDAANNALENSFGAQHNAYTNIFSAPNNVQMLASCQANHPIIAASVTPNNAIIATLAVSGHVSSAKHQAQANLAQKAQTQANFTDPDLAENRPSNTTLSTIVPPVLLDHSSPNEQPMSLPFSSDKSNVQNRLTIDVCSAYLERATSLSEGSVSPVADPCQQQAKSAGNESTAPSTQAVDKDLQAVNPQSSKNKSAPQNEQARQKRYVAGYAGKQTEKVTEVGITSVGGAFILLALLVQTSWLACAKILPIASNYAVTTTQWLLTALFSVIFGIRRAFHLDDCLDIGFALVTGRARPLSHSTFGHLLHSFDKKSIDEFYDTTAQEEVEQLKQLKKDSYRVSIDGHNLARYTRVVDLQKGKIGNSGRILPALILVLAFDLDEHAWLAIRTHHGTNKLSTSALSIVKEVCQRAPDDEFRFFFDKGVYNGKLFKQLKAVEKTSFYTPAKRTNPNVKQWEAISDQEYTSFVFNKHSELASDKRPTYRMADTKMQINVYEGKKKVGQVTLRALVLNNPLGQKKAEIWPFVLLTNDEDSDAKKLINEYGDHWAQEIGHRVGRHDLYLDVLPTGYKIKSKRNQCGEIEREVEFDQSAFRLSAWLRLLVYNLMSRFASQLPANYQKMWAGTLLRKFIRRQATIYLLEEELLIVFDRFPDHEALHPLMVELNAKRIPVPWLNNLVLQFSIANKPMYPLKDPQIRKRLFSRH